MKVLMKIKYVIYYLMLFLKKTLKRFFFIVYDDKDTIFYSKFAEILLLSIEF